MPGQIANEVLTSLVCHINGNATRTQIQLVEGRAIVDIHVAVQTHLPKKIDARRRLHLDHVCTKKT